MNLETQQVFSKIYETRRWASDGLHPSGTGTSLAYTANLRKLLPLRLQALGVKSIFDAPCGVFNWMSQINLGEIAYLGADIVPSVITAVKEAYPERQFTVLDICEDEFPVADLWLCRFCLNHLSRRDIARAFARLLASDIKFVMFTSHPGAEPEEDIKTGGFRKLDLARAPFHFRWPPMTVIEDWVIGFPRCQLIMWRVANIRRELTLFRDTYK